MNKPYKVFGGRYQSFGAYKAMQRLVKYIFEGQPFTKVRNVGTLEDKLGSFSVNNLQVGEVLVTVADLSWTTGRDPFETSILYKVSSANTFTEVELPSKTTSYRLTGLTGGTEYDVKIHIVDRYQETESSIVKVYTKLSNPSGLTTTDVTNSGFKVQWNAMLGVTYKLEIATTNAFTSPDITTHTGAGVYTTDTIAAPANTTRYIRLTATKTNHPDSNSVTTQVTTLSA